jgi:hypothetical protein
MPTIIIFYSPGVLRARRLSRPSPIIALSLVGPVVTTLCKMQSDSHHSAGWDALATAVARGLSFVREPMFGCGLYRSTGMTQVLHIWQVIGGSAGGGASPSGVTDETRRRASRRAGRT